MWSRVVGALEAEKQRESGIKEVIRNGRASSSAVHGERGDVRREKTRLCPSNNTSGAACANAAASGVVAQVHVQATLLHAPCEEAMSMRTNALPGEYCQPYQPSLKYASLSSRSAYTSSPVLGGGTACGERLEHWDGHANHNPQG